MDQIVTAIAQKLGIPEAVVRSGLAVLLNYLKQKAGGSEVGTLLNQIPGANELANAPTPDAGGGNLLGNLIGGVSSLFGGQTAEVGKVVAGLENAGLQTELIPPFVENFIGEAKKLVGEDTVNNVLSSVPALASLKK
ncbi:MAG: DUF2780 domain-containing protein [Chthoniobacterales bacterium]